MMEHPSILVPVLTTVLSAAGIVFVTGFRRGSMVSPMSVALFMLLAIFGVRPIMMVAHDKYSFYGGNNIESGFATASWVGLLSVFFLLFGYVVSSASRTRLTPPSTLIPKLASKTEIGIPAAGVIAMLILLSWLVLMAATGGGISYVLLLFQGRGAGGESALAGVPAVVPALPVVAGVLLAYARINLQRVRTLTIRENLIYWGVIALTVVPPSALGSRRFLLPSILAAVLGALAPHWFRKVTWRMVGLAVVGFLALSIIPFVRSSGSRTGRTDLVGAMGDYFGERGLGGTLENFFLSYDTEMFNYIAFLARRLGGSIEYGLGRGTIGEALLSPIPAALSRDLGPRWSNEILIQAFGGPCGVSYCPVPSISGVLFYDLGLPGVVVGMTVVGALMCRFEWNFLHASGPKLLTLLTLGAFMPQLVRGSTVSQLWIATQIVVLVVAITWVHEKLKVSRHGQARVGPGMYRVRPVGSKLTRLG